MKKENYIIIRKPKKLGGEIKIVGDISLTRYDADMLNYSYKRNGMRYRVWKT